MELNGALSNPRATLESSLAALTDLLGELRQRDRRKAPREALRPRPVPVQASVQAIVEAAGRPIRVRDVCIELAARGIGPFDRASVRKTLYDGSRGPRPRYRRIGWGLYEHAARRSSP